MKFPIYKTKTEGVNQKFDINSPIERRKYFNAKAGKEIEDLKMYLDTNTFVGFLLAKKGAGKGTYSKMLQEIFGEDRIGLIGVGDLIKDTNQKLLENKDYRAYLMGELEKSYRGFTSLEDALDSLLSRSTEKITIPSELILGLIKLEINKNPRKAFFIDGFPRTTDQVSYSLFMRDIINFRDDPDFFVLIDISEEVINERIKHRVTCPFCKTSRNLKLLPTQFVKYSADTKNYYLLCDNKDCSGYNKQKLTPKEGDEKGIEAIRQRLIDDQKLIEMAYQLHGIPKILLRNNIPLEERSLFDDYEFTPMYSFEYNTKDDSVSTKEEPWIVKDDDNKDTYSLLAAPVVVSFIKQLHRLLVS